MPPAGSVLHYQDYAKMGLAVAMVNQYSKENLNEEQAKVNPRDKSAVEKANNTLYNLLLQAYRPTSGKGAEQIVSWIMPEVRTSASNVASVLNNISKGGIDVRV